MKRIRIDRQLYRQILKEGNALLFYYFVKFKLQSTYPVIHDLKLLAKLCGVSLKTIERQVDRMVELHWITVTKNGHFKLLSSIDLFNRYRRMGLVKGRFCSSVVEIQPTAQKSTVFGILDSVIYKKFIDGYNLRQHNENPFHTKDRVKSNLLTGKAPLSLTLLASLLFCSPAKAYRGKRQMIKDGIVSAEKNKRMIQPKEDSTLSYKILVRKYPEELPPHNFMRNGGDILQAMPDIVKLEKSPIVKKRKSKNKRWERTKDQYLSKRTAANQKIALNRLRQK